MVPDTPRDLITSAVVLQTSAPSTAPSGSAAVVPMGSAIDKISEISVSEQTGNSSAAAEPMILSVGEKLDHEVGLDETISSVLGSTIDPDTVTGPAIHKDVKAPWSKILQKGLTSEAIKNLVGKYPVPNNCAIISAPKLNPEVKVSIQEGTVTRDNRIVEKQKRIACCLAGIGNTIPLTLKVEDSQK